MFLSLSGEKKKQTTFVQVKLLIWPKTARHQSDVVTSCGNHVDVFVA